MGRLIIDGNSVFEIDEDCVKRRRPIAECDIEKYLVSILESEDEKEKLKKKPLNDFHK